MSETGLRLFVVGVGSLGRAVLKRLAETGSSHQIVGVITGHRGRMVEPNGVSPDDTLVRLETRGFELSDSNDVTSLIKNSRPDVLVEMIPQNIKTGEPAISYHRIALDNGVNVVSSNKSALAIAFKDMRARAKEKGRTMRCEAAVMGSVPVMELFENASFNIKKIRGIFNATSSLVIDSVIGGSSRARGMARAQALGIAEADPILDTDGWDSAAKSALLANTFMGGRLRVVDVIRKGLETVEDKNIIKTCQDGTKVRLVSTLTKLGEGVSVEVLPTAVRPNDPLYLVNGAQCAMTVETADGSIFSIFQSSTGLIDSANAVIRDIERSIPAGQS